MIKHEFKDGVLHLTPASESERRVLHVIVMALVVLQEDTPEGEYRDEDSTLPLNIPSF